MNIEQIIYNTCRFLHGVDDKLSIATLFLFCYQKDTELFAELLYTDNHKGFAQKIQDEYKDYDVDFTVRLDSKDVSVAFNNTLIEVIKKHDSNGFYKAVFEKDSFAMVIIGICNTVFDIKGFKKEVGQLKMF